MSRAIRVILKDKLYEIVARARSGLPLPPNKLTNRILSGIMARTLRYGEITLCNYVWMNNHPHMHVLPKNPAFLPRFYGEILKKISDSLRALLDFKSLRLWEDRASVIVLAELEDCIRRLIYIFTNPTRAGLVDTIDDYPGLSSWKAFITCPASVDSEVSISSAWYPVSQLPIIPKSRSLDSRAEDALCAVLDAEAEFVPHELKLKPFAWLKQFGVEEKSEIEAIRQKVINGVRDLEKKFKEERLKDSKKIIGAKALKALRYLSPHNPKKRERKIFIICSNKELRISLLGFFHEIFSKCRSCYELVRIGSTAIWPPGTFTPWIPPRQSCVFEHACI